MKLRLKLSCDLYSFILMRHPNDGGVARTKYVVGGFVNLWSTYIINYLVFRAQANWTLTDMRHKDTEQSTIKASTIIDGVTLTDSLIRRSSNE
jgi:hypothetical protein